MEAIKSAIDTGHGKAVLYAGMLGLIFSDIIPTPGDGLYFYQQRILKNKLAKGDITAKEYWIKVAAGYYLYNSAWWALVFGAVLLTKGGLVNKVKVASAMVGGGVVVAVILKNIKKDSNGI